MGSGDLRGRKAGAPRAGGGTWGLDLAERGRQAEAFLLLCDGRLDGPWHAGAGPCSRTGGHLASAPPLVGSGSADFLVNSWPRSRPEQRPGEDSGLQRSSKEVSEKAGHAFLPPSS